MNKALWALQILLGLFFVGTGVIHFVVPDGLPPMMAWMYDVDPTAHYVAGTAEILGGLGLILPGLTRIQTWLTPVAAVGLIAVMILAVIFHVGRDEIPNVGFNIVLMCLLAFVGYGRWRLSPLAA
jgi:uncharacterized membrane protein